jgi:hypothetical protein
VWGRLSGGTLVVAAAAAALLLGPPPPAHAAAGLQLGLADELYVTHDAGTRNQWLDRTVSARADLVQLTATWSDIAPSSHPSGFDARDPGDPHYSWGTLDAAIKGATSRGLNVMILVTQAPKWAEGAHRPKKALPGTWKPRAGAFADFAHAIATRYSGTFLDPNTLLQFLPRVRYWQAWAEANLTGRFAPQWKHDHLVGPKHYRVMLNAFYGAVKGVHSDNTVITSGLAPYGDHGVKHDRTPPVTFWRSLLCLKGSALRPAPCHEAAHFDVAAHNPINAYKPTRHARYATDVTTPDLGRIERVIRKAIKTGRVVPSNPKPFWATELWWDSKPPKKSGVPLAKHARWLEQALYVLWRQGADAAIWFLIRDQGPDSNHRSYKTGLFFSNGNPKPAYTAFRFPFVGSRTGNTTVRVWGEAPAPGPVAVQRKRKGGWSTMKTVAAGSNRVFVSGITLGGKASLRATQGGEQSLVWHQGG